jgi:hypothetical protein
VAVGLGIVMVAKPFYLFALFCTPRRGRSKTMKNQDKHYQIPVPRTSKATQGYIENWKQFELIEVSKEVYDNYYRPIWRTWKRAKRNGVCGGVDWKRCQGDCFCCRCYQKDKREISLLTPIDEKQNITIADTIEDPAPTPEDILADKVALDVLLDRLQELDPDGKKIGELLMDGRTGREIARLLGIAHTTFLRRFKKIKTELEKILKNT